MIICKLHFINLNAVVKGGDEQQMEMNFHYQGSFSHKSRFLSTV